MNGTLLTDGSGHPLALPQLDELVTAVRVVSLPMTTKFRGVVHREAALFATPNGWAEFSPFLEYGDEEAATWLAAALSFGWGALPESGAPSIEVNATLPATAPEQVAGVLSRYGDFGTVKVKVAEAGQSIDDDVLRLAEVRRLFPEVKLRIDANGGWSLAEAEQNIRRLAEFQLEYAEQPVASTEDLARLRQSGTGVLIAADESIRKADDPYRVAELEAADLMVVKVQPLGGIQRTQHILREIGVPAVVSSALETSAGLYPSFLLASTLSGDYAHGLGTAVLLAEDVTADPVFRQAGNVPVAQPVVDESRLERFAADPARTQWWRERIERCWSLLLPQS